MSNFAERLEELIFENGLDNKTLAATINISASCITQYTNGEDLPTIENLVKIADYFNCSTDFLLGFEEKQNLVFKVCPPFSERINFLLKHYECKPSYVYKNADISKSRFFDWKNGSRIPQLDGVIKLAELFECRVDFILGRE